MEFVFHHRFSAILFMEVMPNFKNVQRLQLVFKNSIQVAAITKQVAHHTTLAMESIPPFSLSKLSLHLKCSNDSQLYTYVIVCHNLSAKKSYRIACPQPNPSPFPPN